MSGIHVETVGAREVSLRLETFPADLQEKIRQHVIRLTEELEARVEAATPVGGAKDPHSGLLRSEITERVFTGTNADNQRVAGYVSVFAPGQQNEYAKAATIEYGTNKARRIFERTRSGPDLKDHKRRIAARMSRPVHIAAAEYLRRPLAEMRPEIEDAFAQAIAEAVGA